VRAVALAAATCAAATSVAAAQVTSPALFDTDLTVGAGAALITTAGAALDRGEDVVVPHRLFAERGVPRRAANVTFRLLKLSGFDAPQEHLLFVVNHEVFGHGARLRERFAGPIGYHIDPPPPYGGGGGSTSFIFDREPTAREVLAVHAGGMEASAVAAALVAHDAFEGHRMRPRDALRYLDFELDTLAYVLSTDPGREDRGHDVAAFLETYNQVAVAAGSPPLTVRALRRQALVGLANPMLAYAVVGVGRYLATGVTDVTVPTLSIAGVRYLPMVRYRLAPYGTEWSLVNELGGRIRSTTLELRVGRAPRVTPWAVGVRQRDVASWRGWNVDAAVDVWRQPRLAALAANERLTTDARTGVLVRGRVERPIMPVWFSPDRATLIVDVGVKSDGFVPGEPLRAGIVLRGGVGVPLGP
jgi:hypothetical protein